MGELLPAYRSGSAADGLVITIGQNDDITAALRRRGREQPLGLGVAARLAGRKTVVLRPSSSLVLEKRYVVPTAPRGDLDQMLRHDLARITPFPAAALFWRWDGRPRAADRGRTDVVLTMVPKQAVAAILERLASVGIVPGFLEVVCAGQRRLLPVVERSAGRPVLARGLAWLCGGLAAVALVLPFVLQALALRDAERGIAALQPQVAQVEALRRGIAAGSAGRDVLAREQDRVGDVMQVLATLTRILPDDSFLTDFALRDRHLTISGRSASAPGLITGLSADGSIRDAAFAAPVTRLEGATADVFSISAEVVP